MIEHPTLTDLIARYDNEETITFLGLTTAERYDMTALFRPSDGNQFTSDQRSFFAQYWLDATNKVATIAAYNVGKAHRIPIRYLIDDTPVVPIDLLTWAHEDEGYGPSILMLGSLPWRKVEANEWPETTEP